MSRDVPYEWIGLGGLVAVLAIVASMRRLEVGAWCGWDDFLETPAQTAQTIARARALGVDRLAVFVNDLSYLAGPFRTYDPQRVVEACRAAKKAGLKITIVSWMSPDPSWVAGASFIGTLATQSHADEAEYDLEDGWYPLEAQSDPTIAATSRQVVQNTRSTFRGEVGCDFIVGAPMRLVRPFIELSDFAVPQAYRVARNASISDLEGRALAKFGPLGTPIVMGVAAYWSSNPYQATTPAVLRSALARVASLKIKRVRLWRFGMIQDALGPELVAWKKRAIDTSPAVT